MLTLNSSFAFGRASSAQPPRRADGVHQNVLRLHVQPCIVQRFIQVLVGSLPSRIRAWFDSSFPEWNLPSRVKFEMEKATYAKLRPLQGIVIPKFFGELRYDNAGALLLSDIGGACLATPKGALLELCQAMTALSQFRILQDTTRSSIIFTSQGDKIMIADLERMSNPPLNNLTKYYEDNQYVFWEDGLINDR
ncbi:hypothetical protein QBC46DRAFT_424450 [Diplogelasinospora grovesii]|uniref:Uncharacterized protein n=1 Tax=Diplogelasinospora grovesii TaxID=303347 RepID=A0AAN6MWT8_9PEZI|nr:hypothetical protein QBC46DRAFT_424450 [Diplogelasinospora grovesii]